MNKGYHQIIFVKLSFRLYLSVRLMFAVSLFISYGLQFYVPVSIIWPLIDKKMERKGRLLPWYSEYIFRLILVCVTCEYINPCPAEPKYTLPLQTV